METRSLDTKKHLESEKNKLDESDNSTYGLNLADILKDAGPVALNRPEPPAWIDFEDNYRSTYERPGRSSWLEFEDDYGSRRNNHRQYDSSSSEHG